MNVILPLVINLILSLWVVAIAILSVQNATPVALKFMMFESIQMPVGVVLALSAIVGILLGTLIKPLLQLSQFTRGH